MLCSAYYEDEVEGEKRVALRLHPRIAPYKAAVFPMVKNNPVVLERAERLHKKLKRRWNVFFDSAGALGRRYRRQDEIGTPYGITIDFETVGIGKDGAPIEPDNKITVRDRDTCTQVRMTEDELIAFLEEKIEG